MRRAAFAVLLALALGAGLAAPSAAQERASTVAAFEQMFARWQAAAPGHPLVGRMYQAVNGKLVPRELWREPDAAAAVGGGSLQTYLLLGEVHDNPEHHAAQALLMALLSGSAGSLSPPGVVMEMVTADQAQALADYLREPQAQLERLAGAERRRRAGEVAAGLGPAIGWEKTSWPLWSNYEPIARTALAQGRGIFAGDTRRETIRDVARRGLAAADGDVLRRLRLDRPLPDDLSGALATEIRDSHCGLLPDAAIGGMSDAQRYRDASLAESVAEAGPDGAVLIAGNGHVRSDRGVPWYIRQRFAAGSGAMTVSIMLLEVEEGKTDPESYVPRDPSGKPAADYVLFTPRHDRPDPCEKMRKSFRPKG